MATTRLFYFARKLRKLHMAPLAKAVDILIRVLFGCEIHSQMRCGENTVFAHNGCGIVVNKDAIIGNNVLVFQNVTIGGRKGSGSPSIGDDTIIGNGAQFGANAVVLKDGPEKTTAVGVLARIINN